MSSSSTYFIDGIRFESLPLVLKIYKRQQLSKEAVLDYFSGEENIRFVAAHYDHTAALSVADAVALPNAEQRMVALRSISIEELTTTLNAERIDRQTISKTQIRWDEQLTPYKYTYEDTYELYRIPAQAIGLNRAVSGIYFVRCKCTSTDRVYLLYVSPEIGETKDAIAAIAWTMRLDNKPMSKSQYLHLMYSES